MMIILNIMYMEGLFHRDISSHPPLFKIGKEVTIIIYLFYIIIKLEFR